MLHFFWDTLYVYVYVNVYVYVYVNEDSPDLGFLYFNFLGGYQ